MSLTDSFTIRRATCVKALTKIAAVSFLGIMAMPPSSVSAHDEFKEAMEHRYRLRSVSCKACHTDNKDKKIRNAFGKLLFEALKSKELTKNYNEAKSKGDKAKKQFEKQMVKDFLSALKRVETKPVSFSALLEAGLLNGTRLDKNQVDIDALTITLYDDEQKKAAKHVKKSPIIRGEIKQMPPEEDRPLKKSDPVAPSAEPKSDAATSASETKSDTGSAKSETPTGDALSASGESSKPTKPLGSSRKMTTTPSESPPATAKPE